MKNAFSLLELIIVLVVVLLFIMFIPKQVSNDFFPTKSNVKKLDSIKKDVDIQVKEIERIKIQNNKILDEIE